MTDASCLASRTHLNGFEEEYFVGLHVQVREACLEGSYKRWSSYAMTLNLREKTTRFEILVTLRITTKVSALSQDMDLLVEVQQHLLLVCFGVFFK